MPDNENSHAEAILRTLVAAGDPVLAEELPDDRWHVVFDSGWVVITAEQMAYLNTLREA